MKLLFAQGNPEARFDRTRHNVGFLAIDAYAAKAGAPWKEEKKLGGFIAETEHEGEKVLLIKPGSYYNETGPVARKLIDFYKLNPARDLLVIHDDLALPFGTLRIRHKGSDAGNNGIKSLNAHLGDDYARIRVGIWNEQRDQMEDSAFVLARFTPEEEARLTSDVIPHVLDLVDQFLKGTLEATSRSV